MKIKNPNSFVAVVSAAITLGIENLVKRYTGNALPPFWASVVVGAVPTIVLYVGRDGFAALKSGGLLGLVKLLGQWLKVVLKGLPTSTPKA